MRTYQHIIDTKSVKKVLNAFPDHWVVRELSERDYGTDLIIEIFSEAGIDKDGHKIYESSGCNCNIQIKGTSKRLELSQADNTFHCSLDKKALLYMERFVTPFLLIRVDVSSSAAKTYFVWIQRYIKEVLDIEIANWRESAQNSFTIKIPAENDLSIKHKKIEQIASRIKYIDELVEFREMFTLVEPMLSEIAAGHFESDDGSFTFIIQQFKRILRLHTLLSRNNCCIDHKAIKELCIFIEGVAKGDIDYKKLSDYPNKYNLSLLKTEIDSKAFVENFVAENLGEKVF